MFIAVEMFAGLMAYGYAGIILYMILTGCGFPMPEEVAIIAGGALAAKGQLHWGLTLGSLLIGALLGDCVMYYIGYHFGRRLLQQNRFWNRLITPDREKKVEELLKQHGVKVLLGARFLVGLRGPMYITAGILKVPFRRFVAADLFCATLVVTLFFALSYWYGAKIIDAIHRGEGWLTIAVVTACIIGGGIAAWLYIRRRKKMHAAASHVPPAADNAGTSSSA
ncbi:MAG TPA: DedA family protein [Pirellulales bacterium]|jgi:membrane protein DedA with SNARE-associated domain|nr:DedA family protein [Pirellulales bacterium]